MRKRTVRNGMRLVLTALAIIISVSFYHTAIADLFSWSDDAEMRLYQVGIFCAALLGGYGVVLTVFGLVLPKNQGDTGIRVMPVFFMIICAISIFIYLMTALFSASGNPQHDRLRPGDSITI